MARGRLRSVLWQIRPRPGWPTMQGVLSSTVGWDGFGVEEFCRDLSFLAVEVVQIFGADNPALGGAHQPLLAVGKIRRLSDGIVRYNVKDKILGAVIDELMGFVRLEDKGVPRS